MSNPSIKLRGGNSGPSFAPSTPGYVLTIQADGSSVAPEPAGTAGSGLISFNARTAPDAIPTAGDYDASQIVNTSTVEGPSVAAALDILDGNHTESIGLYARASNDQTLASGSASHAEGFNSRAGLPLSLFAIAPGDTLVTIVGDVRSYFTNAEAVRIQPTTPELLPVVSGVVNSVPAFASGNTTFQLLAPIDSTTTAGHIVESPSITFTGRGRNAHAEGTQTVAVGVSSHAEGGFCQAISPGSHAEGALTICQGNDGHSEGEATRVYGIDGHAEGGDAIAFGFCSHAEGGSVGPGTGCLASGDCSHAEGRSTRTGNPFRTFTIAAGGTLITLPGGDYTLEFHNGDRVPFVPQTPILGTTVYATISTVPVFDSVDTTFSISAPLADTADIPQEAAQVTGGVVTDAQFAVASHAEGSNTVALGFCSHVEGQQGVASGVASHAEGSQSLASGDSSHAEGDTAHATATASHAEGGLTVASAPYAHAEGFGSHASGSVSHAQGRDTTASGDTAHAEGKLTVASAQNTHAEGESTLASGYASHAEGFGGESAGSFSHVQGAEGKSFKACEHVESGGKFSVVGDNQLRRAQVKGSTPGSAPGETTLLQDINSESQHLQSSKAYAVTVRCCATRMGLAAASRQMAFFWIAFAASCDSAGVVTLSAVTSVIPTILQGAAFVGSTLLPSSSGPNILELTFSIAGGLTVPAHILASAEYVEVLGN